MSKVVYLNSHLEKFREQPEIKIELDDLRGLAHYSNINSEDKKTTKIFIECFNNKETYKDFLNKIPKNVDKLGRYYLITAYWIVFGYIYFYRKINQTKVSIKETKETIIKENKTDDKERVKSLNQFLEDDEIDR